jgi:hypothetical protein
MSPRERRLVALLVLVAMIALADLAVIAPIADGFADRARQREDLQARYYANDRIIAAIPRLRRQAEAQNKLLDHFALAAPDAGTASDMLREKLQAAVTAAGGDFRGGEDMPPLPGSVATRVSARLSSAQLFTLLAQVQNAHPLITITALGVGADDALVTGQAATLDVRLEASVPYHPAPAR